MTALYEIRKQKYKLRRLAFFVVPTLENGEELCIRMYFSFFLFFQLLKKQENK